MGGEQYPVLMYGPNVNFEVETWNNIFNIIDKKKWVEQFLLTKTHDYTEPYDPDDSEGINIIFEQECSLQEQFDLLHKFVKDNKMELVFGNNFYWNEPYIGCIVKDYSTFNTLYVREFCKKYSLPNPTFYAGITGELE
jgi:hypothetical protein